MAASCQEIIALMEELAPPSLAAPWDNVGLQVGDPRQDIHKVLVCLDVSPAAVDAGQAAGADLIVSHHPLIFTPLKVLRGDDPAGGLIACLIKSGTAVYCAHTNLDHAEHGVNFHLGQRLGLAALRVLSPECPEQLYKIAVFVPEGHEQKVMAALGNAGTGWIGNYSHCTFRTPGLGTFLPLEGAKPFIGEGGKLEEAREFRLETIVGQRIMPQALRAMLAAHPYEEVAYDVYPLANEGQALGPGRVGDLPQAEPLDAFARRVKEALGAGRVTVTGDGQGRVERVAVCGGSGGDLWERALKAGADVLVTGDVRHHQARAAHDAGLAIIDAGHFATERVMVPALAAYLGERLAGRNVAVERFTGEAEPWHLV